MNNFELREWRMSDVASLAENANNILIWNNMRDGFPHPYSENDAKAFIEKALMQPKPATLLAIAVDGKAVGSIGIILHTDVERINAEMGYFIGENYWNRGFITEAIRQMATYAFKHFPFLHKIYATPFGFNVPSHKALEKAGFEREAILKQVAIKNGKIVDFHYYSLLRCQWEKSITIRAMKKDDLPVLKDLLYAAIFIPEGATPPPREIIQNPEIDVYIKDFGSRKDDYCLLAELNGTIVGGVWVRILADEIKGFGNIDPETPEFAVSVFKAYQKMGVGTRLMLEMIDYLKNKGYKQCSLAVQKANYAVKMYQKLGFEIVKEIGEEYIMLLKLWN